MRVILRYTGEHAVVLRRIDEDTLLVQLERAPDLEIPAFEEDLMPYSPAVPGTAPKAERSASPTAPTTPSRRKVSASQPVSQPQGISVVFEPMPGRDGIVSRYTAWLLNDTEQECLFEISIDTAARLVLEEEGKLDAFTAVELGVMLTDDLSDLPDITLTCRPISTQGIEPPLEQRLRLRPKTFFNARQGVPILGVEGYRFALFKRLEAPPPKEDLREYIRQRTRPEHPPFSSSMVRPVELYNVKELAEFPNEIDLHAEKLLPNDHQKLSSGQILQLQLTHFHAFLERAIRLGVPRVFIIHGVGEGKLRTAIAEELRRNPAVRKFKNEYHHKYGYGATEVIFY